MYFSRRLFSALKASALHFVGSVFFSACVAVIIFCYWYPAPFDKLAGGQSLFWIFISVDVVCGPLLTIVLYNPTKSRRELTIDLGLVVFVQAAALLYGLNSMAQARPLAIVYEVDRFRVVSYADIFEPELASAPSWVQPWSLTPPRFLGIRLSQKGGELLESLDISMAGVEPSQRPTRWQDYQASLPNIRERSHSLDQLREIHAGNLRQINERITAFRTPESSLAWLPLVSRHSSEWVVVFNRETGVPISLLYVGR